MRVVVLGAAGSHKTESSIARAIRALGHACRLVNAVGWMRHAGALGSRAVRYLTDSFEPDYVLLTRHAIRVGESSLAGAAPWAGGRVLVFRSPTESGGAGTRQIGRENVYHEPLRSRGAASVGHPLGRLPAARRRSRSGLPRLVSPPRGRIRRQLRGLRPIPAPLPRAPGGKRRRSAADSRLRLG